MLFTFIKKCGQQLHQYHWKAKQREAQNSPNNKSIAVNPTVHVNLSPTPFEHDQGRRHEGDVDSAQSAKLKAQAEIVHNQG